MKTEITGFLDELGGTGGLEGIRPFTIYKHEDGGWDMFIEGEHADNIESLSDIVTEYGDLYFKAEKAYRENDFSVWDSLFDENGLNDNCREE